MHELGILRQVIGVVNKVTIENHIKKIRFITLDVGENSGIVPAYMDKLFPVACDSYPHLKKTRLKIHMVSGDGLMIKEIGY